VLFQDDQETNSHRDGQNNMEIKGVLGNCFMDVRKMLQTLGAKAKNFSINFHLVGTFHCW
jgi:hypothetical protein